MRDKKILSLFSAASLGCATIASAPALADNEAMLELLKVLRDNGTITRQAYEQLVNAARADEEKNTEG
jgi:phosphate-selective porin OprO and OprP